jgi:hypothetical protein
VAHVSSVTKASDLALMALPQRFTLATPAAASRSGAVRRLGDVADAVEGFQPPIDRVMRSSIPWPW